MTRKRMLALIPVFALFPIIYLGAALAQLWVDVYVMQRWDAATGRDGAFDLGLLLMPVMAGLTLPGYIFALIARKKALVAGSLFSIAAAVSLSALLSTVVLMRVRLPDWLSEPGPRDGFVYLLLVPFITTFALLWVVGRLSRGAPAGPHVA